MNIPSSMLTAVMRFPAGVYTGLPSTSILELDAAAAALSALGTARGLEAVSGLVDGDLLRAGAGFTEASLDVDRWGIFRMSLYLDCLYARQRGLK